MSDSLETLQSLTQEAAAPVETLSAVDPAGQNSDFHSAGRRIHKWSTYLGIDWLFNTAVGVSFAYWGKYSEAGKKVWSGPITRFFTKTLEPFIKNPKTLITSAEYGNTFMSIIMGGMFTIPPLLVLENSKVRKSFAKFYDGLIYGKDKIANDPKFQKQYDDIEHHTPKKDFWTGMWARFAALAPMLAMVIIPVTRRISDKYWFDHVERLSESVAKKMGLSAEKSFKNIPREQAQARWRFIHKSVSMDFGLTLIYAGLHSFFYDLFADRKDKKINGDNDVKIQQVPASSSDYDAVPREQKYAEKLASSKPRIEKQESFVKAIDNSRSAAGEQVALG